MKNKNNEVRPPWQYSPEIPALEAKAALTTPDREWSHGASLTKGVWHYPYGWDSNMVENFLKAVISKYSLD